jgi:hypothetical protein
VAAGWRLVQNLTACFGRQLLVVAAPAASRAAFSSAAAKLCAQVLQMAEPGLSVQTDQVARAASHGLRRRAPSKPVMGRVGGAGDRWRGHAMPPGRTRGPAGRGQPTWCASPPPAQRRPSTSASRSGQKSARWGQFLLRAGWDRDRQQWLAGPAAQRLDQRPAGLTTAARPLTDPLGHHDRQPALPIHLRPGSGQVPAGDGLLGRAPAPGAPGCSSPLATAAPAPPPRRRHLPPARPSPAPGER